MIAEPWRTLAIVVAVVVAGAVVCNTVVAVSEILTWARARRCRRRGRLGFPVIPRPPKPRA